MLRAALPGHPLQKRMVVQWDIGVALGADGAADESVSPQSGISSDRLGVHCGSRGLVQRSDDRRRRALGQEDSVPAVCFETWEALLTISARRRPCRFLVSRRAADVAGGQYR